MKRLIMLCLVFVLASLCAWALAEDTGMAIGDYLCAEREDGTLEILRYTGQAETLEIPSELEGKAVTRLGDRAFLDCQSLKRVTIPSSVTTVGDFVFQSCGALAEVILPDGLTEIGKGMFSSCSALTDINLPGGVSRIGYYAFYNCTSLTELAIPEGVTSIAAYAFASCTSLKRVEIPEGVESILDNTFYECKSLEEVAIPNSVNRIDGYAFTMCNALKRVTIPGSVRFLPENAFFQCENLEEVVLQEGVDRIAGSAFNECKALRSVTLPASLTWIEPRAFSNEENIVFTVPVDTYAMRHCVEYGLTYAFSSEDEAVQSVGLWADGYFGARLYVFADGSAWMQIETFEDSGSYLLLALTLEEEDTALGTVTFSTSYEDEPVMLTGTIDYGEKRTMELYCDAPWSYEPQIFTLTRTAELDDSGYAYTVGRDGQATVAGYARWTDTLIIPDRLGGYPVTGIANGAFANFSGRVREIRVPEGVTDIGMNAFAGCIRLERLVLPESATELYVYVSDSSNYISTIMPSKAKDAVIIAPAGSYAELYALLFGVKFVAAEAYVSPEEAAETMEHYAGCWELEYFATEDEPDKRYTPAECEADGLRIYLTPGGNALWLVGTTARTLIWDYQEQRVRLMLEGDVLHQLAPVDDNHLTLTNEAWGVYHFTRVPETAGRSPVGEWLYGDMEDAVTAEELPYTISFSEDGVMALNGGSVDFIRMMGEEQLYTGFWVKIGDRLGIAMYSNKSSAPDFSVSEWTISDGVFSTTSVEFYELGSASLIDPANKPKKVTTTAGWTGPDPEEEAKRARRQRGN